MNSFTFPPFLILLFFYFQQPWQPIPIQVLCDNSCSSPLSLVLTQEGKPSSSFLNHTPFFFPTLLFYSYFTWFNTSFLYLLFHSPLSGTIPRALPWVVTINNLRCVHFHPNRVAWLGVLWKFTSLWCKSPFTLPQPLMICPAPYQPRFHIFIIPHSFPLLHTILITFEVEGMVNNVFLCS